MRIERAVHEELHERYTSKQLNGNMDRAYRRSLAGKYELLKAHAEGLEAQVEFLLEKLQECGVQI